MSLSAPRRERADPPVTVRAVASRRAGIGSEERRTRRRDDVPYRMRRLFRWPFAK